MGNLNQVQVHIIKQIFNWIAHKDPSHFNSYDYIYKALLIISIFCLQQSPHEHCCLMKTAAICKLPQDLTDCLLVLLVLHLLLLSKWLPTKCLCTWEEYHLPHKKNNKSIKREAKYDKIKFAYRFYEGKSKTPAAVG